MRAFNSKHLIGRHKHVIALPGLLPYCHLRVCVISSICNPFIMPQGSKRTMCSKQDLRQRKAARVQEARVAASSELRASKRLQALECIHWLLGTPSQRSGVLRTECLLPATCMRAARVARSDASAAEVRGTQVLAPAECQQVPRADPRHSIPSLVRDPLCPWPMVCQLWSC